MLISLPAAAQTAEEHFSVGQDLFQKGQYIQALKSFQSARQAGIGGYSITYNLAVTHYKLQQYESARTEFSALLNIPAMRPLAQLNLGLVEDKLGHQSQAIRWFQQAYEQKKDIKVRLLAWQALGQLGIQRKKPFAAKTRVNASVAYGVDTNVLDPVNPASNISDNYLELYASVDRDLSDTLSLMGLFLSQDYSTANSYDFQLLGLNLDKQISMGNWSSTVSGMFNTSTLAGSEYQTVLGAQLQTNKDLGKDHQLRLRYRYQQISSVSRPYLTGWRMKLRAEGKNTDSGNRLRYELELNDRADSATTSYSPTVHTLRYYMGTDLNKQWKLDGYVGYRLSDYTQVAAVSRSDQRLRARVRVKHKLSRKLELQAEYTYTTNQSNVASYAYNRNLIAVGLNARY